ncbi:hypothetical protein L596_012099 [Steinernema carpocapsae]|uniref:Uncharacterized protein n=1 Tax=Steinernema carpocapsae TaxID=34508 RepID=A0A4U5NVZ5_STECR|nr:hypothetical protein L596_012099 [Steinernema carpocapsae]
MPRFSRDELVEIRTLVNLGFETMSVEDTPMEVDVAEVDEVADDAGKPMELVSLQNELNNIVQKLNGLYCNGSNQ